MRRCGEPAYHEQGVDRPGDPIQRQWCQGGDSVARRHRPGVHRRDLQPVAPVIADDQTRQREHVGRAGEVEVLEALENHCHHPSLHAFMLLAAESWRQ
ncbi:hypothetical protein GCM10027615_16770 [Plantactinospora veratri]